MHETTYGLHLMLRIADICNREALNDGTTIADYLLALVHGAGMRVLAGPLVGREGGPPEKCGCSGVVILYESHAAIHTYPCPGEAFIDIFSCRDFQVGAVMETTSAFFGSYRVVEQSLIERGMHWGIDIQKELQRWVETR